MILNTRHVGLVVEDIEKSIKFYQALGLTVWKRQIESGDFISTVVGIDNVEIETAKLKVSDQSIIELLEYKSHKTKKTAEFYLSNKHGCSHVSFTVENLDDIAGKITELGGSIVNLPSITDDGVFKVMYCHDLDGIIIELVEELK
tara:strand:+ start:164 stop:598 length:435 start_codon:yes stop_codon:yes gene_type:complete